MMNRRNFLKIGGLTALLSFGYKKANAFRIIDTILTGAGGSGSSDMGAKNAWDSWDAATEADMATTESFCNIPSGNINDDETGEGGGLAGADLVLSDVGGVAGTGGGYRLLDGAADGFSLTTNAVDTLLRSGSGEWTIAQKIKTKNPVDTDAPYWYFANAGATTRTDIFHINASNPRLGTDDIDHGFESDLFTNNLAAATEYWLVAWHDNTINKTRGGACKVGDGSGPGGQPIKWSDFPAALRVEHLNTYNNFASFDGTKRIGNNGGNYLAYYYGGIVIAKTSLISNA